MVRVRGSPSVQKGTTAGGGDRRQENGSQSTIGYTVHLKIYQSDSMFQ